jgi:hypothetical protein
MLSRLPRKLRDLQLISPDSARGLMNRNRVPILLDSSPGVGTLALELLLAVRVAHPSRSVTGTSRAFARR